MKKVIVILVIIVFTLIELCFIFTPTRYRFNYEGRIIDSDTIFVKERGQKSFDIAINYTYIDEITKDTMQQVQEIDQYENKYTQMHRDKSLYTIRSYFSPTCIAIVSLVFVFVIIFGIMYLTYDL